MADQRDGVLARRTRPRQHGGRCAHAGRKDLDAAGHGGVDLLVEQGLRAHIEREEVAACGRRHLVTLGQLRHPLTMAFRHSGGHRFGALLIGQAGRQQQIHPHRVVRAQRTQRTRLAGQLVRAVPRGGIHPQAAGARDRRRHLDVMRQANHRHLDAQPLAQRVAQAFVHHGWPQQNKSGSKSRQGWRGSAAACCSTARPIRPLWTSLVPSPIWLSLASRRKRASGKAFR